MQLEPKFRRQAGFTLVEVLVTLIVTSLILSIVMNAALQAKTRAVATLDKEEAVILARGLIAGRAIAPYDPATRRGESDGLRWTVSERPVAADAGRLLFLSEILVSVRDAKGVELSALQVRKIKAAPRR